MAGRIVLYQINKGLLRLRNAFLTSASMRIARIQQFDDLEMVYDVSSIGQCDDMQLDCDDSKLGIPAGLFDSLVWAAVPKSRRSRERRATRKFGIHKIREYMTPKINVIACLECGHYHEAHTLCGHCYKLVKEETESRRNKVDQSIGMYASQTEVVYLCKKEDVSKQLEGDYIVEVDKTRPEWFPEKLLSKGHGHYE